LAELARSFTFSRNTLKQNITVSPVPAGIVILTGLLLFVAVSAQGDDQDTTPHLQAYIDAGYAASNLSPSNGTWRSKSTTATLNSPELFLGMVTISKAAVPKSRWGFELGLQTGLDSENLVTSPPPASNEPVQNADSLRQLYRANVSYLFGEHGDFRLTGGLINSYIGYESFLGIDNPNYTRTYLIDSVPYFMFGMEAAWKFRENIDLNFYLVSGYNYLANPNDVPSGGMQIKWSVSPKTSFTQNIYYGPDQGDTSLEYWRFLSNSIIEWRSDRFLAAAALDFVREKRADQPGEPVQQWSSGALWLRWAVNKRLSFALRPEFFRDEDGLSSGARQTIRAYTATMKYEHNPTHQRLVAALEFRYDESTGEQGGFYDSPNDRLVPHQSLILASVMWGFDR